MMHRKKSRILGQERTLQDAAFHMRIHTQISERLQLLEDIVKFQSALMNTYGLAMLDSGMKCKEVFEMALV